MKEKPHFRQIVFLPLMAAAAAAAALYSWSFYHWVIPAYNAALALLFLTTAAGTALFALRKGRTKRSAALRGIVVGGSYVAVISLLTFLINNVITKTQKPWVAALTVTGISFLLWLLWGLRFGAAVRPEKGMKIPAVLLSLCLLAVGCLPLQAALTYDLYQRFGALAPPVGTGEYTEKEPAPVENADLYIAPDGSDGNDGTFDHPLATIEKARDLVRAMDKTGKSGITVALKAGEYSVKHIEFTAADGGTENCPITYCACGDGEVILNGGVTLDPASFTAVTDGETLSRLSADAKENVVCADLTRLGLTAGDWGKLYPVGSYGTAANYDGDTTGPVPCVLYYNGAPMTTARYPDSGTLKTESIVREGEGLESATSNHAQTPGWESLRNPETTIFTIDRKTADRVNGYATLDGVWLWTALMYNWADATSPLKSFHYEEKTLEPAYVSKFGAVPGSDYYIFNVLEELDRPGEWYLDRDAGLVYLYPEGDLPNAQISLSLSTEDLITVTNAGFLRFEGLSLRGTRGGGFAVSGTDILISGCTVSEVSGVGVRVDGYRNTVKDCEFAHIGATGADISGGERETLTPGENRVENCLFHDYSEVALTAGGGVNMNGVGNVCSHNEFYNSPQQAIFYGGNDMLVEYNLMHDVALLSDDCSAVYCGRRWDCCGSVVRYNLMYNLGDKDHHPNGIYWDDGMAGQTAYGNLIINCKQNGFLLGGGRDLNVWGNILLNCKTPVSYDDRARDGVLNADSWFKHSKEGADMQQHLEEMPWQSELWQKAYPYTADWVLDYSDTENPNFIPNPANSKVNGNVIVQYAGSIGGISDAAARYSDISGNAIYKMNAMKKLFVDPDHGDYTLRDDAPVFDEIPEFEQIPLSEIGRY